ncbi:MAG: hypothetical protein HUJ68_04735 [Clostridia bacterium]|nr:hypothetical protein [Clostridia bacterium]
MKRAEIARKNWILPNLRKGADSSQFMKKISAINEYFKKERVNILEGLFFESQT